MKKLLIGVCVYNEGTKVEKVFKSLETIKVNKDIKYAVLILNDGSTDKTTEICKQYCQKNNWKLIEHKTNMGVGKTLKDMMFYGIKNKYDVFTCLPGNNKVKVKDLEKMYLPVINENYDYVKGSRYLQGAKYQNLPTFRKVAIPIYSFLVSTIMQTKISDVTCLVNALKLSIFKDYNINIKQEWLDKYELEYYVLYYVLKNNLKFKEVPINVFYPKSKTNYSKIKPFSGWWSMIRPWVLLKTHIKK